MKVSIVIPTLQKKLIDQCLNSLFKYNYEMKELEVIVINNGSPDISVSILENPNIKCIDLKENIGFTKAVNLGWKKCNGDYVITLNDDTIILKGSWIDNLINPIKNIKAISGTLKVDPFSIIDGVSYEYIDGHCFCFNKNCLKDVGFFDERFSPGYFEDTEYSHRAKLRGYKLINVTDNIVGIRHLWNQTGSKVIKDQMALTLRNQRLFKNLVMG